MITVILRHFINHIGYLFQALSVKALGLSLNPAVCLFMQDCRLSMRCSQLSTFCVLGCLRVHKMPQHVNMLVSTMSYLFSICFYSGFNVVFHHIYGYIRRASRNNGGTPQVPHFALFKVPRGSSIESPTFPKPLAGSLHTNVLTRLRRKPQRWRASGF